MRYLLYLPGIILILLPILRTYHAARQAEQTQREREALWAEEAERRRIEAERRKAVQAEKAAQRERARAERDAQRQRKQAARLEYARQRAEYAERELAAKRESKAIERAANIPAAEPEPIAEPEPVAEPEPAAEPEPEIAQRPMPDWPPKPNAFRGQVVAFTGRLPGMTRREAIEAVQASGGRAYTKMPAGTTLLVVGDKPGMRKMDKADEWIGQVRKITPAQFFDMLNQPPTLELDELIAVLQSRLTA